MTMIRGIAIAVALLFMVAAIALIYLHYGDMNRHKARIEGLVSSATGRDFRMEGDIQLRLWPLIQVAAGGMKLANAPWSEEADMATIDHLAVSVMPGSILSGPIRVTDLELKGVRVLVENNEEGLSNWALGSGEPEGTSSADSGGGSGIVVEEIEIADVLLIVREPDSDDRTARLDHLSLSRGDQNMDLVGRGEILQQALALSGSIGPLEELSRMGAVELSLAGTLGDLALDIDGEIAELGTFAGPSLKATVTSDDIAQPLAAFGNTLPLAGPLRVEADVNLDGEATRVLATAKVADIETSSDISLLGDRIELKQTVNSAARVAALLEVEGLPDEPLELSGVVVPGDDSVEFDGMRVALAGSEVTVDGTLATDGSDSQLQVAGKGESLARLLADLPDLPFEMSGDVTLEAAHVTLEQLQLQVGDSDLQGSLRSATGGDIDLTADLTSKQINLAQLQGPEEQPASGATGSAAQPGALSAGGTTAEPDPTATAAGSPPSRYLFQETPLPFETLRAIRAKVDLRIDLLTLGAGKLLNVAAAINADQGQIKTRVDAQGTYGGIMRNFTQLDASGDSARLRLVGQLRDMHPQALAQGIEDPKDIPSTDLSLDITATGASPRQLAAGATGGVLFTQGAGKVNNGLLGTVSGDIFAQLAGALNPFSESEAFSNWECSISKMDIGDGRAELKQLILQGEKVMIVGGGDIDLQTEEIRIEFNTKPREGIGVSADMFVKPFVALRGTLASPAIGMNETGTLVTAGAAVATGGLSFLVKAAADRIGGVVDHCQQTLPDYSHPPLLEAL